MKRKQIGKRIEQLRTRAGLSTLQLAKRIGKSQATISRIENGKQNVNIELLSHIASTLRVHPFALLTDAPLRHSVLLPPTTMRSDGPMRILARTLQAARLRAGLELSAAAGHLGLGVEELEAIEAGYALPDREALELMADLYSVAETLLTEMAALEERYPRVSERMAVMHHYIGNVLMLMRQQEPLVNSIPELKRLQQEMDECFDHATAAAERKASCFSIAHLSDRLLRALQDPDFHEQAEALARVFAEQTSHQPTGERPAGH